MTEDMTRRTMVQGRGASSLVALPPSGSQAALPSPTLDLEALLGSDAMANAKHRYQDGIFVSSATATPVEALFTEDGRFNLSAPIRHALAEFLSDGKDVLVLVPGTSPWRKSRDCFIVRLYRNFVILPHYYYSLHGELAAPPHANAILLTRERYLGLDRAISHCIPPFRACRFF